VLVVFIIPESVPAELVRALLSENMRTPAGLNNDNPALWARLPSHDLAEIAEILRVERALASAQVGQLVHDRVLGNVLPLVLAKFTS